MRVKSPPSRSRTTHIAVAQVLDRNGQFAVSRAEVALGWLLAQGPDIVPIPGSRSGQRGAESVAAAYLTFTPKAWT